LLVGGGWEQVTRGAAEAASLVHLAELADFGRFSSQALCPCVAAYSLRSAERIVRPATSTLGNEIHAWFGSAGSMWIPRQARGRANLPEVPHASAVLKRTSKRDQARSACFSL